jgi:hypothetical protein
MLSRRGRSYDHAHPGMIVVLDASIFTRELRGGTAYATYLMGARGPEYRRDDTAGTGPALF